MFKYLLPGAFVAFFALVAPAAACSEQEQIRYLTGALYREANPSNEGQAAVAQVIFNRLSMPEWRADTICDVVTAPSQFQYRVPSSPDAVKYALAAENAQTFLEGHETGNHRVAGHIFEVIATKQCYGFRTGHSGFSVDGNRFLCKR